MSSELDQALDAILSGDNVFISGGGGRGKSTFIKGLKSMLGDSVLVSAMTGVAAFGVDGITFHKAFKAPTTAIPTNKCLNSAVKASNQESYLKQIKQGLIDYIVIDEVSMMNSGHIYYLDKLLQRLTKEKKPFGGLRIILVGDLLQLPPVLKPADINILREHIGGTHFYDCDTYNSGNFKLVNLTKNYRQDGDMLFSDILDRIRLGKQTVEDLEVLNSRVLPREHDEFTLCATNKTVNHYNDIEYSKIDSTEHSFTASSFGMSKGDYPLDEVLTLKVGTRVMLRRNCEAGQYVNGDTGVVKEIYARDELVTVLTDKGDTVIIQPHNFEKKALERDKDNPKEYNSKIVASFKQLPLSKAYATTVHKSQGMTLQKAHIDMSWFPPALAYVALSRMKTLEGFTLERPLQMKDIKIDARSKEFLGL